MTVYLNYNLQKLFKNVINYADRSIEKKFKSILIYDSIFSVKDLYTV